MIEYKVSHRYAKSLLELSNEQKVLENVYQDVQYLYSTLEASRDLRVMLDSPIIKHLKKKSILNLLFSESVNKLTQSFLNILCEKGREKYLYAVLQEFISQYNTFMGIQEAEVITSVPLKQELRSKFEEIVKDISGKKQVKLVEKIKPEVIGGFVLKIGDRQIDDSISGKLNQLRRRLIV